MIHFNGILPLLLSLPNDRNDPGTGISIFGGNRPNYGTFSLVVDGQLLVVGTAKSTVPSAPELLGTVSGLSNGPHTAVFANTNGQPVDIDSIELQSQVGTLE